MKKSFGQVALYLGTEFLDNDETPIVAVKCEKLAHKIGMSADDFTIFLGKFFAKRYRKLAKRNFMRYKKKIAENAVEVVLESDELKALVYKHWISEMDKILQKE